MGVRVPVGMFGTEKLAWCGYPTVKKFRTYVYSYFDRIHEHDRQTDGQTDTTRRHRPRLCIEPDDTLNGTFKMHQTTKVSTDIHNLLRKMWSSWRKCYYMF